MCRLHSREVVAKFKIDGEPIAKARPRFSRRAGFAVAFTVPKTQAAEHAIGHLAKLAMRQTLPIADASLGVSVLFCTQTQRKKDIDNMLKLVLDGCNKIVYADDKQVEEVYSRILRGHATPHTCVTVYCLSRFARTGLVCSRCGPLG